MFWNTINEMETLRREMDRLFYRHRPGTGDFPLVNVHLNEDTAVLTAELPGLSADDLDITCKDNTVTIRGQRQGLELAEGQRYLRQERGHGKFVRSFTVPYRIENNKVEAAYRNGILCVKLPRAEADKPRKIEVAAG